MSRVKGGWRIVAAVLLTMVVTGVQAERVKDLASISGVRDNQLIGYGLVVGLDGSGDQTGQAPFTAQSLRSMLNRLGVVIPPGQRLQLKNVAAVALHATLRPFAKPGQTLDVTVSTIGNAKSLRGGTLLVSPLKALDGRVYAMAQGNVVVGGFSASTGDGNSVTVNVPTVGRIPNGGIVERPAPSAFGEADRLVFNLNRPDFTTAKRVAEAINKTMGPDTATPADGTSIVVKAPAQMGRRVTFVSLVENITVEPGEAAAKVIVNSRTGTVVIGQHVTVGTAAVSHGNLAVTITNTTEVSQPVPFASGRTVVVPNSKIRVEQEPSRAMMFTPGVTLDDIVRGINQVGAAPSDIVAILEALREAGALSAELEVI